MVGPHFYDTSLLCSCSTSVATALLIRQCFVRLIFRNFEMEIKKILYNKSNPVPIIPVDLHFVHTSSTSHCRAGSNLFICVRISVANHIVNFRSFSWYISTLIFLTGRVHRRVCAQNRLDQIWYQRNENGISHILLENTTALFTVLFYGGANDAFAWRTLPASKNESMQLLLPDKT